VSAFDGDRVTFRNGDMVAVMQGEAVGRYVAPVASFLDGRHSVEEIALATDLKIEYVRGVIKKLEDANLLIDGDGASSASPAFESAAVAASCWGQLVDIPTAAERLASSRVAIVGSDGVSWLVARQLVDMGLSCCVYRDATLSGDRLPEEALDSDLVVLGPSVVQRLAREVNEALYEARVPWLPVFPFNGRYTEVGPLIVPPDSGCFECFLLRRQSNVSYSTEVFESVASPGNKGALAHPPLDYASAATAAFIAYQWLAVRHPEMPGALYIERAGTWEREIHRLLRVPRCPVCSVAAERGIPAGWWSAP
jgi:bacteriocin biosynthesis cyclodehydratase domain-containing protein